MAISAGGPRFNLRRRSFVRHSIKDASSAHGWRADERAGAASSVFKGARSN